MERVIYKNYKIVLRNLIVGINWYKLLIFRKIMFSIKIRRKEIKNMRFFFLSVYNNDTIILHIQNICVLVISILTELLSFKNGKNHMLWTFILYSEEKWIKT